MANPIYKLTFHSTYSDGVQVNNGLHYRIEPGVGLDPPPADDILGLLNTELTTLYRNCCPVGLTVIALSLSERLSKAEIAAGVIPHGAALEIGLAGTLSESDSKCSEALTPIIQLRSGTPLRSARGYMAMPSPRSTAQLATDGKWGANLLTPLNLFCAKLDDDYELGSVAPASVVPVVYSRTRHERGVDPWYFQVQAATPLNKQRWRRSRITAP